MVINTYCSYILYNRMCEKERVVISGGDWDIGRRCRSNTLKDTWHEKDSLHKTATAINDANINTGLCQESDTYFSHS